MALSAKAKRVLLRLDDGQILGCAATLGITGVPSDSAAVLDVDAAFKAGKLPPTLVQKLEGILRQIAEKVSGSDHYHLRTVNNVIRVVPRSPPSCRTSFTSFALSKFHLHASRLKLLDTIGPIAGATTGDSAQYSNSTGKWPCRRWCDIS